MAKIKALLQNFFDSSAVKNFNKIIPFTKRTEIGDLYSKRVANTKSSAIREILKVVGKPGFISFAGGLPDESLFPLQPLQRAAEKVIQEYKSAAFQYSLTEGFEPLRQFVVDTFYKGTSLTTENIIITHGSQQGLDLVSKIFIDPDNRVGLSEPCYLGALQVFKAGLARIHTVDTVNISETEIERYNRLGCKFFYIIPDFDNPTGWRMSLENREKFLRFMKGLIIEDTAYRYLSFKGDLIPSLLELDQANRVVQFGSFSKIIAPGFRIGWIAAPKDVVSKLVATKQYTDLHSNSFGQLVIYQYLKDEDWRGHIDLIRDRYRIKRDAMVTAIQKYFPEGYTLCEPDGGMFVWVNYNQRQLDFYQVLENSIQKGVAVVPGSEFAEHRNLNNCVRLNYTHTTLEKIEQGIKILGESIQAVLK